MKQQVGLRSAPPPTPTPAKLHKALREMFFGEVRDCYWGAEEWYDC